MPATTVHVAGPALIRIASPAGGTLEDLGYTRSGADISFRNYTEGVPSDLQGGELGPPIDVQYFGETADITTRLTSYDTTAFNKIMAGLAGGTAGTPGTPGALYFADNHAFRLLINATSEPMNFPRVIFQQPREMNKGTRFTELVVAATAYENAAGVLWNAVTT